MNLDELNAALVTSVFILEVDGEPVEWLKPKDQIMYFEEMLLNNSLFRVNWPLILVLEMCKICKFVCFCYNFHCNV